MGSNNRNTLGLSLPPPMPQTGFQYFAFHWSKEPGPTVWTDWRK